ncbi:MAG: hypothetical protein ACRD2M_10710, partial [Terriglobales bacterium]
GWKLVPPTIDTAMTAAMILLCEPRSCIGARAPTLLGEQSEKILLDNHPDCDIVMPSMLQEAITCRFRMQLTPFPTNTWLGIPQVNSFFVNHIAQRYARGAGLAEAALSPAAKSSLQAQTFQEFGSKYPVNIFVFNKQKPRVGHPHAILIADLGSGVTSVLDNGRWLPIQ